VNDGGRITMLNVLVLFSLLVLPAIAFERRAADFGWVLVLGVLAYPRPRWTQSASRWDIRIPISCCSFTRRHVKPRLITISCANQAAGTFRIRP
jgi:hypothetical protein